MSRRVRTHANPLKAFPSLSPPAWNEVYADLSRPFVLELGSSRGQFLLRHANRFPDTNILGVEIRKPLVEAVLNDIKIAGLRNVHSVWGNIARRLSEFTPSGRIDGACIFFPDPWPKKRHHKRRVVSPELLCELALLMPEGSPIDLMTDHLDLLEDIVSVFAMAPNTGFFRPMAPVDFPIQSDWEEHCIRISRPFQKLRYVRC